MTYVCPSCQAPNDDTAESCFTCGAALSTTLRLGSVIAGRYEIQQQLGKGGMGVVYRAHDRLLDEQVAIKVLRPEVARDPEISRRFQSEIKLARRVSHKNVCRIHEYGEDKGLRYISMEYMQGVDLRQILRERGGLPAEEAFQTSLQIADGLGAIHDVGVIHRDLKTPNIMRDTRGQVRLMDFGIAKEWGAAAASATATGLVMGTPEYMSPEQARGEKIDFRSDIYALGIVIFEIFTGRVPFRAETPLATILKHLQEPPPLDGPESARIPPAVREVLRKTLAKDPGARYATVEDLGSALRSARAAGSGGVAVEENLPTLELRTPPSGQPPTFVPPDVHTAPATRAAVAAQPQPTTYPTPTPLPTAVPTMTPTIPPSTRQTAVPTPARPAAPIPRPPMTPPPAAAPYQRPMGTGPVSRPAPSPSRTGLWVALGLGIGAVVLLVGGLIVWKVLEAQGLIGGTPSTTLATSLPPVPDTLPPTTTATLAPATTTPPGTTVITTPRTTPPPPETTVATTTLRPAPPTTAATLPPVTRPPTPAIPPEVAQLMGSLREADGNTRWKAAEALGNLGAQAAGAVPALTSLLSDRQETVRWRTAEALGKIGPDARSAVPALVRGLSENGLVATESAKALGRIGSGAREAVPTLAGGLRNPDVYFRREVAKALVRIGPDAASAVPALIDSLRDKDKVVRLETARALGRMGGAAQTAIPALTEATKDSDDLVKRAAAQSLEAIRSAP
jgi:serine/threonine protein kinase